MPTAEPSSAEAAQKCDKCGAAAKLVTCLARLADRPAYRIFECTACNALTWIEEMERK
jgi:DNA-directed RNA polymerase subunit M/transcription elongation factor TFIIS